jgi:enoyl-CoA hydratase
MVVPAIHSLMPRALNTAIRVIARQEWMTDRGRLNREVTMADPDVLSTRVEDGIAVVTLGSPKRIFFDPEMGDALLETLTSLANDEAVRVVVVTGGAPGYFVRHYSVAELVKTGERLRTSGRKWAEDTPYKPGSFANAMRVAEQMPKPVIAAISGSAMGGGFEFTLACDIRVAQLGEFEIGLPEINLGILPGGGGTQRLPRVIGTAAALMHILMGVTLSPLEAAHKGLVHEAVPGNALDRAMEIARRLATHTPQGSNSPRSGPSTARPPPPQRPPAASSGCRHA